MFMELPSMYLNPDLLNPAGFPDFLIQGMKGIVGFGNLNGVLCLFPKEIWIAGPCQLS